MRYLVTTTDGEPFLTEWFDAENNFNSELGMVVYDLETNHVTYDGKEWLEILIDHL